MSESQSAPGAAATAQTVESAGLLEQILSATKQTERDQAQDPGILMRIVDDQHPDRASRGQDGQIRP